MHIKFRVHVDENNEATCWDLICRHSYQDRLPKGSREKVVELWETNSHVIPYQKNFLQ